jgi:membrane-associated HD superfamily phosphohydrolase
MNWDILVYIISMLVGMFVVWQLGRDEYYDEEKLIDLFVVSSIIGYLTLILFNWVTQLITTSFIFQNITILNYITTILVSNRISVLLSIIIFLVTGLIMIRSWHWPVWPLSGILMLGFNFAMVVKELIYWYWRGLDMLGIFLLVNSLSAAFLLYLLKSGGEEALKDFYDGLRTGWRAKRVKGNNHPQ